MSNIAVLPILLVTALVCLLPAALAQAQAARTFVSAAGSDSNNCTNVVTPCRHFAAAYAAAAADGEIDVLDPANYGALTISHGISVQGHGWASLSGIASAASITINGGSPSDKINISGVILDGGGPNSGTGIQFNSGGSLIVRDSVIRNFNGNGIYFAPSTSTLSQIFVSNTQLSDNGGAGINIGPEGLGTTNGVLDHVQMENNGFHGLYVVTGQQTINITVSDSVSASNLQSGIAAFSGGGTPVGVMVRNTTIANNKSSGLRADNNGTTIRVTRSTITGNGAGWANNSATLWSYADNNIDGNGSVNSEPPNPLVYH
jgi:hypothetical protein